MLKIRWLAVTLIWMNLLAACTSPATEPQAALSDTAVPNKEEMNAPSTETSTTQPPAPTEAPMLDLPDLGPAAEFKNDTWLNADEPVTLAALEGKVVLLEFWTFG